jgi:hypothetical protein
MVFAINDIVAIVLHFLDIGLAHEWMERTWGEYRYWMNEIGGWENVFEDVLQGLLCSRGGVRSRGREEWTKD